VDLPALRFAALQQLCLDTGGFFRSCGDRAIHRSDRLLRQFGAEVNRTGEPSLLQDNAP
jgi:hypothetical protein